jgi:serine/threonine-protein kinase
MPPPRRPLGRRIALVLVPLLTLLTGAAVAAVIVHGLGTGAGTPEVAAQTQDGDGYVLKADDYLGRPVDDVAIQLSALGLTVHRRVDRTSDAPGGTVTAVDPVGVRLHTGDVVTIRYAVGDDSTAGQSSAQQHQQAARGSLLDDAAHTSAMDVSAATGVDSAAPTTSTSPSSPAATTSETSTPPTDTSGTPSPTDTTTPSPTDTGTPTPTPSPTDTPTPSSDADVTP